MIRTILLLAVAALPSAKPLFDFPVRDTCVCLGPDKTLGFEGAFLTKIKGRYHLICAEFNKHGKHLR